MTKPSGAVLFLLVTLSNGCTRIDDRSLPPVTVDVWLGGCVDKIQGLEWPKEAGVRADTRAIQTPADVRIHFPSGRVCHLKSKMTFLGQKDNVLSRITLTPAEELLSFREAVDLVGALADKLGIQGNEALVSAMESWRREQPDPSIYESSRAQGCDIEEGIALFLEIKPHRSEGGWFVSAEMTVSRFFVHK